MKAQDKKRGNGFDELKLGHVGQVICKRSVRAEPKRTVVSSP